MMKKTSIILLFFVFIFSTISTTVFASKNNINHTSKEGVVYLSEEPTGKGVKVAVIDSGISKHPDLNVVGGKNFVGTSILYRNKNTFNASVSYQDDSGHGTNVAGIIAGKKTGIAPDVELYSLKVLNSEGLGFSSWIAKAVDWSIENDMDIINMSTTIDSDISYLTTSITKAIDHGIIVISSAGNNGSTVMKPASIEGVISVGALNEELLDKAYFSAYIGKIDYMAKGSNVHSTSLLGAYVDGLYGTSFSAPYVTGIFALYKEAFPEATAEELKEIVSANAKVMTTNPEWKIPQKPSYLPIASE